MSEGRKMFPAARLILIAAVAGGLAGAAAVYVTGSLDGNNAGSPRPAEAVAAGSGEADRTCAAKTDAAKALAAEAKGEVAAMLPADPPVSLAGLAFNDPEGRPMTLGDRAGRTMLVNLWATWCAPCRAEMPALDALQKAKGGDAFEVAAINVDTGDNTKPKRFLAETGVSALAYYRENTLALFNDLKKRGLALGLPVTLLVDREGCLLAHMNGPAEWAGADASRLIDAASSIVDN